MRAHPRRRADDRAWSPPFPPQALAAIRAPFLDAGASRLDAPVLQPLGLLLDLAGEAMRARLFVVQAEGGEEACLRPDFTIPVARAHIDSGGAGGPLPLRGQGLPRRARAAPTGAEEFLQIGLEAFERRRPRPRPTPRSPPWPGAPPAPAGASDLSLLLGDVGLFAAFIDSPGPGRGRWRARLKRAFAAARACCRPSCDRARRPRPPAPAASRLAGAAGRACPKREAAAVLEELWALAGIEPVGGRSRRPRSSTAWPQRAEAAPGAAPDARPRPS